MPPILLPRADCAGNISGGALAGIILGSIAGTLLLEWLIRSCFFPGAPFNRDGTRGRLVYSASTSTMSPPPPAPRNNNARRPPPRRRPGYVEYVEKGPARGARVGQTRRVVSRPERVYVR